MLCIAPNLKSSWEAWSAIGSLVSAFGTFVAAGIALFIWLRDRKSRKEDRTADAQVLAMLMLSEISALAAVTHTLASNVPTDEYSLKMQALHFAQNPKELANGTRMASDLRTPRLERLSERSGVLPAQATKRISALMTSLMSIEGMHKTLITNNYLQPDDINEIFSTLITLHEDAKETYLALAEASGANSKKMEALAQSLENIPS
ncbi:hypothetical protein K8O61_02610 [Xanthomonas cerealis pv. cerealis]|uniref:hypothetical protein n=1 Tax=Xanthomonas translucens group TaxID=3390202 RepID=UPI000AF7AC8C|nr:hypothetical protein [Xanthomonas translucens]UKE69981.1 hypothetical protein K8O61_02610 [Xanthomonas translucens pv. pistacia]